MGSGIANIAIVGQATLAFPSSDGSAIMGILIVTDGNG
jgi:hypothetical protein